MEWGGCVKATPRTALCQMPSTPMEGARMQVNISALPAPQGLHSPQPKNGAAL